MSNSPPDTGAQPGLSGDEGAAEVEKIASALRTRELDALMATCREEQRLWADARASDPDHDPKTWWPDEKLALSLLSEGYPTELPATPLVTLTEGATWLARGFAHTPAQWKAALGRMEIRQNRLRELWFHSDPACSQLEGNWVKLDEFERAELMRHAEWWQSCIESFNAQVNDAAIFILANVANHGGEVRGRLPEASETVRLQAHDTHKPLRFDPERNKLVFDPERARQLASTFKAEHTEWTDIAVTTAAIRALRTGATSPQTLPVEDMSLPDPKSVTHSGLAGRPTTKHLIAAELEKRIASGEALVASPIAEAKALHEWVKHAHPQLNPSTIGTIANNIRGRLRMARTASGTK